MTYSRESGNIGYTVDYEAFKWQHEKQQPATLLIANDLSGNIRFLAIFGGIEFWFGSQLK